MSAYRGESPEQISEQMAADDAEVRDYARATRRPPIIDVIVFVFELLLLMSALPR